MPGLRAGRNVGGPHSFTAGSMLNTSGAAPRQRRHGIARRGPRQLLYMLAAALALAPALASAGSWWNEEWKFRKEISFDLSPTGANVAATVQDVPVLVRLSLGNFSYFGDAKPDGADFRVLAADDKTPLKFHFERYDAESQMAFLWIHVPQVAAGSKSERVFVYYGNPGAAAAGDAPGTYDVNQTLVLHFGEASGAPVDATAYKNNASTMAGAAAAKSLIAGGASFTGGQLLTVPASPSLRLLPNQGFTASVWAKPVQLQGEQTLLALSEQGRELVLGLQGARAFVRYTGGAAAVTVQQPGDLAADGWHHFAVTAGAGQVRLFVDGENVASAPVQLVEIGGALTVGGSGVGVASFNGEIDEVECAKVARPPEWIRVAAKSQGIDALLVVYGGDAQKEGGQGSYFGTILRNLTVDGWVIIGICMAMLAVALVVMVLKALYLRRVEVANRRFLEEFRRASATLLSSAGPPATATEQPPGPAARAGVTIEGTHETSTLYQLYVVGVGELQKRIGVPGSRRPGKPVSAQAVEAIRASVDATSTRLQQQLSARMVLLTIAISGGPFLGLLGTVIGVMITFAAIAASGDVNVNAIAPGTAAALAATVAGLSVAIPSLFGYNWLNSRIKAINADQRVFADELIAQIAEQHS
jgi:biopolymer transport protein ExbB